MHISPHHMEIEAVYSGIWRSNYRSIAITSSNPQEGVTTLASTLTQRNLLAGHSTLLVDLNVHNPSLQSTFSLAQQPSQHSNSKYLLNTPELVNEIDEEITFTGVTAPIERSAIIQLRKPGVLESHIQDWLTHYDTVIVDASSLNHPNHECIPAERIASACDAAILVVLAGSTREMMIANTIQTLQHNDVNIMGCVINDKNNPALRTELLRETKRLEKFSPKLTALITKIISRCDFLMVEP